MSWDITSQFGLHWATSLFGLVFHSV